MKQKIRKIADINAGYQFRGKVEAADDSNASVIQIKDFDDRLRIRFHELVAVRLDNPVPHFLIPGDVLFLARGHRLFATLITEPIKATIASGYFFVIRADQKKIRPEFLSWSLNQPEFQEILKAFTQGTHMPLVSKAEFQDLPIDVPALSVQNAIIEFQKLVDQEQELSATLLVKRGKLAQAVSRDLLSGQLQLRNHSDGQ